MSKYEKLIAKLLNRRSTITYLEIAYLLEKLGYKETQKGKTSGSRVAFINKREQHIIRLHKPHPGNELKDYVKKEIISELKDKNLI
jgi:murein L,D-transpeptidase YafK